MTVAGILPAIAGDFVGAPNAAGCEHHGLGPEELEAAALAVVTKGAGDAVAILQQGEDGALHVKVDALVNAVVLQGADHLESGAIADVGQARVLVAAEVALQNLAVGS